MNILRKVCRRRWQRTGLRQSLLCILLIALPGALVAQGTYETIVLEAGPGIIPIPPGTAAPDGNGYFSNLGFRQLNNHTVLFDSFMGGTSAFPDDINGVFSSTNGSLAQVLREGQLAPDGDGEFNSFITAVTDGVGSVAVGAILRNNVGGFAESRGLYLNDGTTVTELLRSGTAAPGGNGEYLNLSPLSLNSSGDLIFSASLTNTSGGFGVDDQAIYRYSGGTVTEIVRLGGTGPNGGNFITLSGSTVNPAGDIAFGSNLGIFRDDGGPLTTIVEQGALAPDGNGTVVGFSSRLALNSGGETAFMADLNGTSGGNGVDDEALYLGDGNTLAKVARLGDAAPDGNGTFSDLSNPALGDDSRIAFRGEFTGTSNGPYDDAGLYIFENSSLTKLLREGDISPDDNSQFVTGVGVPVVNNAGTTAFLAAIAPDVTAPGGGPVILYLTDGVEFIRAVTEGDALAGSSVTNIRSLLSGANSNDLVLNDSGRVLFEADLANGQRGIFTYAPDQVWRTNGNGLWDDSANWRLSILPSETSTAQIVGSTGVTIDGPTGNTVVRALWIDTDSSNQSSTVNVSTGNLTVSEETKIGFGDTVNASGGTVNLDGNVENLGNLGANSGGLLNFVAGVSVQNVSITRAADNGTVSVNDNAAVTGGLVEAFGGGALVEILQGGSINNAVVQAANGGTLDVANGASINGGSVRIFFGGQLTGSGDINADLFNANGGIVNPGNSPGLLSIDGDYTQDSLSTLIIELAGLASGGEYDVLDVTGTANLGGTLNVDLLSGFLPNVGDSFDFVRAATIIGEFGSLDLPTIAGIAWELEYLFDEVGGSIDVARLTAVQAVPIPAAAWLFASALALLSWIRRKHAV